MLIGQVINLSTIAMDCYDMLWLWSPWGPMAMENFMDPHDMPRSWMKQVDCWAWDFCRRSGRSCPTCHPGGRFPGMWMIHKRNWGMVMMVYRIHRDVLEKPLMNMIQWSQIIIDNHHIFLVCQVPSYLGTPSNLSQTWSYVFHTCQNVMSTNCAPYSVAPGAARCSSRRPCRKRCAVVEPWLNLRWMEGQKVWSKDVKRSSDSSGLKWHCKNL